MIAIFLFRRIQRIPGRVCVVLAYFWAVVGFAIIVLDVERRGVISPQKTAVILPAKIATGLWLKLLPMGVGNLTMAWLAIPIGFFLTLAILYSPFYFFIFI